MADLDRLEALLAEQRDHLRSQGLTVVQWLDFTGETTLPDPEDGGVDTDGHLGAVLAVQPTRTRDAKSTYLRLTTYDGDDTLTVVLDEGGDDEETVTVTGEGSVAATHTELADDMGALDDVTASVVDLDGDGELDTVIFNDALRRSVKVTLAGGAGAFTAYADADSVNVAILGVPAIPAAPDPGESPSFADLITADLARVQQWHDPRDAQGEVVLYEEVTDAAIWALPVGPYSRLTAKLTINGNGDDVGVTHTATAVIAVDAAPTVAESA